MSTVFYDRFLKLEKIEKKLKKIVRDNDEFSELALLIDELIHYRVLSSILKVLPKEHHAEFASLVAKNPADEKIIDFLKSKAEEDIIKIVKEAVLILTLEITGLVSTYGEHKKF
ncbi:MAG: hypothetical protein CH104c_0450 [Candidatus Woesebacteria bacterium]|nr:MAG: hypothetical protein CH104c_0450 [Candidatus Woesebacteria bacterium]